MRGEQKAIHELRKWLKWLAPSQAHHGARLEKDRAYPEALHVSAEEAVDLFLSLEQYKQFEAQKEALLRCARRRNKGVIVATKEKWLAEKVKVAREE